MKKGLQSVLVHIIQRLIPLPLLCPDFLLLQEDLYDFQIVHGFPEEIGPMGEPLPVFLIVAVQFLLVLPVQDAQRYADSRNGRRYPWVQAAAVGDVQGHDYEIRKQRCLRQDAGDVQRAVLAGHGEPVACPQRAVPQGAQLLVLRQDMVQQLPVQLPLDFRGFVLSQLHHPGIQRFIHRQKAQLPQQDRAIRGEHRLEDSSVQFYSYNGSQGSRHME